MRTHQQPPLTGDIVHGCTATTGTIITIPANRVWAGWISLNVGVAIAASGSAVTSRATISVVGANATPAAGVIFGVWGVAPAATATTGICASNSDRTFVIISAGAAGATLTLQVNSVNAASATAAGQLVG